MNILVKWPTRQRPDLFLRTLRSWRRSSSGLHRVRYVISLDADDPYMQQHHVARQLAAMPDVFVRTAAPEQIGRSKIAACNADIIQGARHWGMTPDILILASDDMTPQTRGWDRLIAECMQQHFPAMDGAVHFNDGYHGGEKLMTLPIMGWNLYRRFGYVYHPDYQSFYSDNELTEVARLLGKYNYQSQVIIRHDHIGRKPDELYRRNNAWWNQDQQVYTRRTSENFSVTAPILSILIASLEKRDRQLNGLLNELHRQIFSPCDPSDPCDPWNPKDLWAVEIHVSRDNGRDPVGAKRDALLRRARGKFICFIDDDDMVSPDYVGDILATIHRNPQAHCVVFAGRLEVDGRFAGPFDYSISHQRYFQQGNCYYRTPNHLCPVRRELALQVGFKPINCGEDTDFAARLYPLLKTEAPINESGTEKRKVLYIYRFSPTHTATQKRKCA